MAIRQILIDKDIGGNWFVDGITANTLQSTLESTTDDEEIQIVIDSCGGSVIEGISIFNLIRDYSSKHKCTAYIRGLAASIASYIAIAVKIGNPENKVTIDDNSVFFIHNARGWLDGDFNAMRDYADELEMFSNLICDTGYAKVSTDTIKDIHRAMDKETFYIGNEIIEHGYADYIVHNEAESMDNNTIIANFKARLAKNQETMKAAINVDENSRRLAAKLIKDFKANLNNTKVTVEDKTMTVEELKTKNPDVYDQIFLAGVQDERSRVCAHLKMAGDSGDVCASVDFIKDGTAVNSNVVTAKYHEVFCKTQLNNARNADNVVDITTPGVRGDLTGDECLKAYKAKMGVK